jgi:hypothetical protein
LQLGGLSHNIVEAELPPKFLAEPPVLLFEAAHIEGPLDDDFQFFVVHGLADIIECALLNRFHGRFDGAKARNDDDRGFRRFSDDVVQHIKAAGSAHLHVGEHQIDPALIYPFDPFLSRIGQYEAVSFSPKDKI